MLWLVALPSATATLSAQQPAGRVDAVGAAAVTFSDEQADRGDQVFSRVCAQCHTRKDMASPDFRLKWNGQTAYDLFNLVRTTMPDSAPGSLSQDSYANVTAYLMKLNGMRAGGVPMPMDSLLKRIKLDIPATDAPSHAVVTLPVPFAPRYAMSHRLSFRSSHVSTRIAATALAAFAFATPIVAHAQARQAVIPAGTAPNANLSPGTRVGNLVYSSGQLGLDRAAPDTTVGGQTKIALGSIKKVFETAGSSMAQALKCTVFLIDVKDFAGMNAAYQSFFPDSPPARTTVVVAALVAAGAKVEIECVAAIPGK
jgi:2-iminobutanoate/2-iminopropanoate deaminase